MERKLTDGEKEILQLLRDGLSTKQVAAELKISEMVVNNKVYRARAKLMGLTGRPVRNREEAVVVAREQGIIE